MRPEPEINAVLVEHMAAGGEEAEETVVLEFQQTDGAFEAVILPLAEVLDGGVEKSGERLEERRVEASVIRRR